MSERPKSLHMTATVMTKQEGAPGGGVIVVIFRYEEFPHILYHRAFHTAELGVLSGAERDSYWRAIVDSVSRQLAQHSTAFPVMPTELADRLSGIAAKNGNIA